MAKVEVLIDEVDQMESLIRTGSSDNREGYEIEFSQLSRGSFGGVFTGTRWDLDRLTDLAPQADIVEAELAPSGALEYLSIQRYEARVRIRGASPGDRTAFYVVGPATRLVRHRGERLDAGSLVVVPPGSEMDFLVEGLEMATFSLDQRTVESVWQAAGHPSAQGVLPIAASGTSLFELANSLLTGNEGRLRDLGTLRLFEEAFGCAVVDARPSTRSMSRNRTRRGVRRAEAALRNNLVQTVPSHVLAQLAGLPLRTLQHAFRREFGVGPRRYHTLLRMRAARRFLLDHHPDNGTVAAAATAYGFEHLGRFSVEYRRQFGEPPSATLKRRSGSRT